MFSSKAILRAATTLTRTVQTPAVRLPTNFHASRSFSSSPIARAFEPNTENIKEKIQQSPIVQKMTSNPEIMEALKGIHNIMQSKGMSTNEPPSKLQMLKLAANSDFRTAAANLMAAMEKAGIDVKSKEVIDEMMSMSSLVTGSKGDGSK